MQDKILNTMPTIAVEEIITLVCTEFVKQNKHLLIEVDNKIPYLKLNFAKRCKLSEKLITKMENDYARSHTERNYG